MLYYIWEKRGCFDGSGDSGGGGGKTRKYYVDEVKCLFLCVGMVCVYT